MNDKIIQQYLRKFNEANTNEEVDEKLDEIIFDLKSEGITIPQILMYFKSRGNEAIPKAQDHRNSISNSNKAQAILQKLLAKLKK